ncbi:MAG: efflux RND transporter periplasmic adaptor subunit [Bryobacteraceae bacterium]|nr:efflux RND transporter periplasmic adaptor subunit [Bryobacteraceae bacterium]
MRGKWILAAAAAILLGAAAGALSLLLRNAHRAPTPPQQQAATAPDSTLSLSGVIRAQSVVGVPAPIDGALEEVLVAVGEAVHRDQALAHIGNSAIEADVTLAQRELRSAEERVNRLESQFLAARLEASRAAADTARVQAEFYKAEKDALRQQMLHREGATPRRVYEQAQADFRAKEREYETVRAVAKTAEERVAAARQEVDQARALVAESTAELEAVNSYLLASDVVSPVDGVVTAITAPAGAEVHPEQGDLFQIAVDLSRMEVVLEPPPDAVSRLAPGQAAQVFVAEAASDGLPGVVRAVAPGEVVVEFASPAAVIRPGLTAQVRIDIR